MIASMVAFFFRSRLLCDVMLLFLLISLLFLEHDILIDAFRMEVERMKNKWAMSFPFQCTRLTYFFFRGRDIFGKDIFSGYFLGSLRS